MLLYISSCCLPFQTLSDGCFIDMTQGRKSKLSRSLNELNRESDRLSAECIVCTKKDDKIKELEDKLERYVMKIIQKKFVGTQSFTCSAFTSVIMRKVALCYLETALQYFKPIFRTIVDTKHILINLFLYNIFSGLKEKRRKVNYSKSFS